jgi:hypothetical protein
LFPNAKGTYLGKSLVEVYENRMVPAVTKAQMDAAYREVSKVAADLGLQEKPVFDVVLTP